jgi:VWFA-related protein
LKKVPVMKNGRRIRRVVILVTDGFDSSSIINLQELISRANDANVTVYSITIPNYLPMQNGTRQRAMTLLDLSELIPHTGGMDYPADTYDFTPIFKSIKEELAASYTLAYYPSQSSRTDGKFHSINVKISAPGVKVRLSRQGFSGQDTSRQK